MTRLLRAVVAASVFALVVPFPLRPAGAADSGSLLTWNRLTPSAAPSARVGTAMALDVATGTTVLFGGRSGSQLQADTWTWDGSTWTAQNPATSPPPLASASMAYDNIGHRILLFGGIGTDGNAANGTWGWDGTTWTALAPAPATVPPPRYAASMAADAATGTDVLFGGLSASPASSGAALGDTWAWDGANWTQAAPAASPSARSDAAMTNDPARGVAVLFGGTTGSDKQADTWTWDGKNWTQEAPASSPPGRSDATLAFDAATETAVLFGGSGAAGTLGDTWLWNGSTWTTPLPALSLLPNLNPSARSGASMAEGPGNHRLVLFGGQSAAPNPSALSDSWTVATLVSTPPPPPTTTPASASTSTTTVAGGTTSSTTAAKPPPTTTPPTTPAPRPAPADPLTVTSSSVHRGQQVTVSGSGFAPGATVTITFHSARVVVVGTTVADAHGRFSTTVLVPTDIATGTHHIEAAGPAPTGGRAVLVAQVSIMAPAAGHRWLLPALMVSLTVLLAAAAGLVLTASTRWHPGSAGD